MTVSMRVEDAYLCECGLLTDSPVKCDCGNELGLLGVARPINRDSMTEELLAVLKDAQEELRLIRMKDTSAVYDPTVRIRIQLAIEKAEGHAQESPR